MATATVKKETRPFGKESNGILMTPQEFDRADFVEGWRYELTNGVLVVTALPSENEADPNEELGYLLRGYKEYHAKGAALDTTLPERIVRTGRNRRRADRLIWAGLGRRPKRYETPTIIAEFSSRRKRDRERDYVVKRAEYMAIRVKEYWIIDRFERIMTVFSRAGGRIKKKVFRENDIYRTDLLPGFELPLARLLALANWPEEEDDTVEE